jgi:hypothetical protein
MSVHPARPPGDRSERIKALGVVQVVLGGLSGLMVLIGLGAWLVSGARFGRGVALASLLPSLFYALPAANLLVTGIGSLRLAPWARRATIVSAAIWLVLSAVLGLGVIALLFGFDAGSSRSERTMLAAVGIPLWVLATALPVVLLVLYSGRAVRDTFERRRAAAGSTPPPAR